MTDKRPSDALPPQRRHSDATFSDGNPSDAQPNPASPECQGGEESQRGQTEPADREATSPRAVRLEASVSNPDMAVRTERSITGAATGEVMLDAATDRPLMPLFRQRGPLAEFVISICGLIALATPLVLWVSWTQTIFNVALALGLVSIAICWLVVHFSDAD